MSFLYSGTFFVCVFPPPPPFYILSVGSYEGLWFSAKWITLQEWRMQSGISNSFYVSSMYNALSILNKVRTFHSCPSHLPTFCKRLFPKIDGFMFFICSFYFIFMGWNTGDKVLIFGLVSSLKPDPHGPASGLGPGRYRQGGR